MDESSSSGLELPVTSVHGAEKRQPDQASRALAVSLDLSKATDFAPANPTDNRGLFDYESKWDERARKAQLLEGIYLGALWVLGLSGIFALSITTQVVSKPSVITSFGIVFCAGLLGGTTFDVKWWYHSIAKGLWHLDRCAWRIFVPWVAALVASFAHILFKSKLLGLLNSSVADEIYNMLAFGFLLGYFSDSAVAKLAEIAELLFGASRERQAEVKDKERR